MTISTVAPPTDDDDQQISEIQASLLDDDLVSGSVDYKGRSSIRSKSGSWKSSAYIIGIGVAERFAYYGISGNLVSYLTGSLGQSTASAASQLNAWFGIASLLPILGAFVADSFWGRFRTIIGASLLYILALIFLTISAALTSIHNSQCKKDSNNAPCAPPQWLMVFFFVSWYLVAIAQGGHTPCIQAFGADQFDDENRKESKAKSSFFNWWYCISSGGILVPLLCITYVQEHVGWELGFGIPAIVIASTLILFLFGTPSYRFRVNNNEESPFVRISRVFIKTYQNWKAVPIVVSDDDDEEASASQPLLKTQYEFLDKALLASDISLEDERFCSVEDIEDTKSILRLIPIWCTVMGYSIVYAQPSTLFTKQAGTMDRTVFGFEIPAASFQNYFITTSLIIFIPLYDRLFVPIARAITKKPAGITMLQRIGIGLFMSLISIVYAAIIEKKRLATAVEYGLVDMPKAMIPMSAIWLAPQYVLSGIADVFTMIGLQEFFYEQVPYDLKSVGLALYLSILGIGSLLSSFMVSVIQNITKGDGYGWFADNLNRAHLDYFYWLLSGISGVGLAAYIYFTRSYVYRRRTSA